MTNNEFKKVLADLDQPKMTLVEGLTVNYETIRRALLICDRLMQKVTNDMLNAASANVDFENYVTERYLSMDIWYAMRDQLLTETTQQTEMKDE